MWLHLLSKIGPIPDSPFFFQLLDVFYLFFTFCFFLIYNIVLVLPYIKMNLPQVYMCSPSWTLISPPSPYHPSESSQCTSPKHPVSCIEPGLATHFIYDIIHVSMPFSQIIPPSPSPTESKRLFYTSVSLLLSRIQGYCYHLSKSMSSSNCCFLTCRFLRRQVRWSGIPISLRIFHSLLWSTQSKALA